MVQNYDIIYITALCHFTSQRFIVSNLLTEQESTMSHFKQETGVESELNTSYDFHDGETPCLFNLGNLSELVELDQFEIINNFNPGAGGLLADQEDTMDIANQYNLASFVPVNEPGGRASQRGPPKREILTGPFDFHVEVKSQDTHKRKYLYSHNLNRIYVDMEENFSIHFVWDYKKAAIMHTSMLVRATTVFSDISQAEKRVERCVQHTHDPKNKDINKTITQNVLHSSRELDSLGVTYCGDPNFTDSWYSVLVEFTPKDNDPCNHAFKFVCKNSCSSGINRRGIDIIFTLEDRDGNILGRQSVGARVCSCPRRDMLRDEREAETRGGNKRAVSRPNVTQENKSKKVKIEVAADEAVITLPPLQIIGSRAVLTGLEVMLSMMQQAATFKRHDQQAQTNYNSSIQALKTKIDEIKNGAKPPPAHL